MIFDIQKAPKRTPVIFKAEMAMVEARYPKMESSRRIPEFFWLDAGHAYSVDY